MPWSENHKEQTRQRILEAAATMFRERGIEQTSVAEVMKRAGLTHGGFYAHFKSKDELAAEAIGHASAQVSKLFDAPTQTGSAHDELLSIVSAYLSQGHMTHPERGCPVAALGTELVRSGPRVRRVVSKEMQTRIQKLYQRTAPDGTSESRRQQAIGILACMVGGQILARSLNSAEGAQFLADCQEFLRAALGDRHRGSESKLVVE
jgi:TetR/AcrR family transcriptional repressor of nem operon